MVDTANGADEELVDYEEVGPRSFYLFPGPPTTLLSPACPSAEP